MREYVRAMTAAFNLNGKGAEAMAINLDVKGPEQMQQVPKCAHGVNQGTFCGECFKANGSDPKAPAHNEPAIAAATQQVLPHVTKREASAFVVLAWTPRGMAMHYAPTPIAARAFLPSAVHDAFKSVFDGDAMFHAVGDDDAHTFAVVQIGTVDVKQAVPRELVARLHSLSGDLRNITDAFKALP